MSVPSFSEDRASRYPLWLRAENISMLLGGSDAPNDSERLSSFMSAGNSHQWREMTSRERVGTQGHE